MTDETIRWSDGSEVLWCDLDDKQRAALLEIAEMDLDPNEDYLWLFKDIMENGPLAGRVKH